MPETFTISNSRLHAASDVDIRLEINGHTCNERETSSILRSIERFGDDASISRYEIEPRPARSTRKVAAGVSWTVRALRD